MIKLDSSFLTEGHAISEVPFHNMKYTETATLLYSGSRADMDIQQFIAPFPCHPTSNTFLKFNPNHVPFRGRKKGFGVSGLLTV